MRHAREYATALLRQRKDKRCARSYDGIDGEVRRHLCGSVAFAKRVLHPEIVSIAVVWNGLSSFQSSVSDYVIRMVAQARRVPVIALEMHTNNTLFQFGPGIAVNAGSEINAISVERGLHPHVREFLGSGFDGSTQPIHQSPSDATSMVFEKSMVLFLAHVWSDTSVVYNRGNWKSQSDVLKAIIAHCEAYDCIVFYKVHPASVRAFGPHDPTLCELGNALHSPRLQIDAQNRISTRKLIEASSVCVTFVSSSGLFALMKGKEVIVAGHAPYARYAWFCPSLLDLAHALRSILWNGERKTNASLAASYYLNVRDKYTWNKNDVDGFVSWIKPRWRHHWPARAR